MYEWRSKRYVERESRLPSQTQVVVRRVWLPFCWEFRWGRSIIYLWKKATDSTDSTLKYISSFTYSARSLRRDWIKYENLSTVSEYLYWLLDILKKISVSYISDIHIYLYYEAFWKLNCWFFWKDLIICWWY